MNRNNQKLIFTFILSLVILFTSCNHNISGTINFSDTADKTVESGIYRMNTLDLPDGYKISSYASDYASTISKVITHGGRIYAACNKLNINISGGQRSYSNDSMIYSVDLEGGDEKIYPLDSKNVINSFDMDSEGNFYLLAGFSILYKLNPDGILISQIEISEPGSGDNSDCLKIGDDGKIYLTSNTCIKILNSDLVFLYDIEINQMNLKLQFTPEGKMLAENIYTGYNGLPQHFYINEAEKRLEKADILTAPANVTEAVNSYSVKFGEGYDIYFYNSFGLYGYNTGDENAVMLCDWVNSGLYFEYTRLISVISPDIMVCISRDMFAETDIESETVYDIIIMTRDENAEPKITVTLAYADRIDEVLLAAINFNRFSEQYRIVFKDYSIYNTPEDWVAENKFKMDLVAGVIPDMMLLSSNMPYDDYIDKGMFADLYGFFDRDGEMSRDDILYAVRTRYETDGKLYCLPTSFFIETLTGKASLNGEKESLTLDEFYGLYEKAGTGASVCNIINTKYFLKSMLRANLGDFVDYENLTCSFSSEKFIKYIGFIKNLPVTKRDMNDGFSPVSYSDFLKTKENKLYLSQNSISGPDSFIKLKYIYGADKFAIKGFPTENTNGSLLISPYTFGISAGSECKNGAFEFLKYYLSDKMQTSDQLLKGGLNGSSSGSLMDGLPVTVSALNIVLDKAAGTYYYLMEMDSYQTKILGMISEYGTYDPELDARYIKDGFTLYRFTDEDAKWFRDYLTESRFENKYDAKINEIIWEELDLYFEGAVTAEKAAENIQNRVAIYVNERYG